MADTWLVVDDTIHNSAPIFRIDTVIMDLNGDFLYYIAAVLRDFYIYKVRRSTREVVTSVQIAAPGVGDPVNYPFPVIVSRQQDDDYLYLALCDGADTSNDPLATSRTSVFLKFAKSNLSEIARDTYVSPQCELASHMQMGQGWNDGKILILLYSSRGGMPPIWGDSRLLIYNKTTMALEDTVVLCNAELDPIYGSSSGYTDATTQPIIRCNSLTAQSSGDIFIGGTKPTGDFFPTFDDLGKYPGRIIKVDSSLAISTFFDFPNYPDANYVAGKYRGYLPAGLVWDATNSHFLYHISLEYPEYADAYLQPADDAAIVIINGAGSIVSTEIYPNLWLSGDQRSFVPIGLYNPTSDINTYYNGTRSYFASDSVLVGFGNPSPGYRFIQQINPIDGTIISSILYATEARSARNGTTYNLPSHSFFVDPEGRQWGVARITSSQNALMTFGELPANFSHDHIFCYGTTRGLSCGFP